MSTLPELENYLVRLDRALGAVPLSDKAEIVIKIKNDVLSTMERDSSQSIIQVLDSLGEPETVANRYLIERGLKPKKTRKNNLVKWIMIGVLGSIGLFCFTALIIVWKFTPVLSVDEKKGKVVILGGLIDIDESEGTVKMGSSYIKSNTDQKTFEGKKTVNLKDINTLNFMTSNGDSVVTWSKEAEAKWNCKITGEIKKSHVNISNHEMELDLSKVEGSDCQLTLPAVKKVNLSSVNGKFEIRDPESDLEVNVTNGDVTLSLKDPKKYDLKLVSQNGEIKGVKEEGSQKSHQYKITVRTINGDIEVN